MKTFYGISLFLLCFIVSYGEIFAVDVTITATLTRTRSESVTAGATSGSCGGSAPTPQTFNFNITVVDSVTTEFTVRVVEKGNVGNVVVGPSTHNIVNGVNYNLANGELTHTITSVPSRKYIMVVQLFKGNSASGTPYLEQEISTARSTKVQSGVITIGDVGNDSDDASLPGALGVVMSGSKDSDANASEITVNIGTQEDENYVVLVTIDSQTNGSRQANSQIRTPVVYDKQVSSFKVYLYDNLGTTQNIRLNVMIQGYQ